MSNLIYWEILQGTVDWTNKVYTSQYTIDTTVELWIGWVPYTSFTTSWRIITLTDAVPEWEDLPILDYYFTDNITAITNADITVATVLTDTLTLLWITAFNNAYKQTTSIDLINECYFTELNKIRDNRLMSTYSFTSGDSYKYWEFYRGDILPIQDLISNYTPRVGKLMINWFITDFTTRTDSSFTLPDWLTTTPNNGDIVLVWYKIPDAIKEISYLTLDGTKFTRMTSEQFWVWNQYATYLIKDWYLFISYSDSAQIVCHYTSKNDVFTLTTDIIDIDLPYKNILSLYVWYNQMIDREDDRRIEIENKYTKLKRKYIAYLLRHSKRSTSMNSFNWPLSWL